MKKRKKTTQTYIRRAFWGIFMLFGVLVVHFIFLSMINRKEIASKSMNKRLGIMDEDRIRGSIYTKDGITLADTRMVAGEKLRKYPQNKMAAHVVGYAKIARSGLELWQNFTMEELYGEFFQWINLIATDESPRGKDIYTTIHSQVQEKSEKFLEKEGKGAVVVIEVDTGKIITMASSPTFAPEDIAENWTVLNDTENTDSPLLNRSTSGLYEPGSTFKIIVAIAALEIDKTYQDRQITCTGEAYFDSHKVRCFKGKVHGEVDMKDAMAYSCNIYFATLGNELGVEVLRKTANNFLFNEPVVGDLPMVPSQFVLDEESQEREILDTSFGQGKTLTSPLHMALITASIANGGVMMKPMLVDKVGYKGKIIKEYFPQKVATVTNRETAFLVTSFLEGVVIYGTGGKAKSAIEIAGKTGTAENPSGKDHAWFVSFAPVQNPQYAICTFLEGSGVSTKGQVLSKEIYELLLP